MMALTTVTRYVATIEVLEFKSSTSLNSVSGTLLTIFDHGLSTGDFIVNVDRRSDSNLSAERGSRKVSRVNSNQFTIETEISGQTAGDTIYMFEFTDKTAIVRDGTINISLRAEGQDSATFEVLASEVE
jgi:hypothetical protein